MKQILMVFFSCALALLAGCGGGHSTGPAPDVSVTPWTEIHQWPDNDFTRAVPEPEAGTVTASMEGTSAGYDFLAVQLDGLSREEVRDYLRAVEEAGMEFLTSYDAGTREPVREDSQRIYIIAREKGKMRRE